MTKIFTIDLTVTTYCQIDGEDFVNFCGLLRKHELYIHHFSHLESNGESSYLPYLETTLPQERPGTVTITQSSKRVSTSLASVERPRSATQRHPGKLDDFKKSGQPAVPPMKVVLPRQDSKSAKSSKAKPWDEFAKQALGSPKQVRAISTRIVVSLSISISA